MLFGSVSLYFVLNTINTVAIKTISDVNVRGYLTIAVIITKLLLYFSFIFISSGNFYYSGLLKDLRKYKIKGTKLIDLNKLINENNDSDTMIGYIIAENKKVLIFRTENYCAFEIKIDDIETKIPLPKPLTKPSQLVINLKKLFIALLKKIKSK
jgi:hypothetical protein